MKRILNKQGPESDAMKTGMLLSEAGLISSGDIRRVLSVQKNREQRLADDDTHRLFGMILCDLNLVTPVDLYCVLDSNDKLHTIEADLVNHGNVSREQIRSFHYESGQGRYSFLDLLLKNDILTLARLQRQLFGLYHIPYRLANRFGYDDAAKKELPLLMDEEIAAQNIVIPLMRKNSSLVIGITSPKTLVFLKELNLKLSHYRLFPVFIPLARFKSLYLKLYDCSLEEGFVPEKDVFSGNKTLNGNVLNNESRLSFRHKIVLSDPEKEHHLISDMYSKYEMLRELGGREPRLSQLASFRSFIRERFKALTTSCRCSSLEIVLTGENQQVDIVARPFEEEHLL